MFIPRIYYPHLIQINDIVTLDKTTSHHLTNVLRLKNGESVILFNGEGGEYTAQFHASKKSAQILILSFAPVQRESSLDLHLGQGLARGDRMDFVIQKATELGANHITPLFTRKCNVKLDNEKMNKRQQHWQNIAISATEQCGRTQLPIVHPPLSLIDWVKKSFAGTSVVFDITSDLPLKELVPHSSIRIAIGPESGWDEEEVALMISEGFNSCTLGPRWLRTETAGLTALSVLQGLFGDLSKFPLS